MLEQLPFELRLKIFGSLPQKDLCTLLVTSVSQSSVAIELLRVAYCKSRRQSGSLLALLISEVPQDRARASRVQELEVHRHGEAHDAEVIAILQLATKLTHITFHGYVNLCCNDPNPDVRGLSLLHSLPFHRTTLDAEIIDIPDRVAVLNIVEWGTTSDEVAVIVSQLHLLPRLHTLTLNLATRDTQIEPARMQFLRPMPSVKHLSLLASTLMPMYFIPHLFPKLTTLFLEHMPPDPLHSYPLLPISNRRLHHCQLGGGFLALALSPWRGQHPQAAQARLQLDWLESDRVDSYEAVWLFLKKYCAACPAGLSIAYYGSLNISLWLDLNRHTPDLRWLEVSWVDDAAPQTKYAERDRSGIHFPGSLVVLHSIVRTDISLDPHTLQSIPSDEHPDLAALRERVRRSFGALSREHIPTLRYLVLSIEHPAKAGAGWDCVQRTWACYRVSATRGLVEVPTGVGGWVMDYCKDAVGVEAFDEFDGEYDPDRQYTGRLVEDIGGKWHIERVTT